MWVKHKKNQPHQTWQVQQWHDHTKSQMVSHHPLWFFSILTISITWTGFIYQYHIQYASRPYSRWLSRFMWLFYYFNIFYWPKYTELCQNLIWWSKSQYYDYDQIVTIACTLQIQYHMQNAFRPYPGWLSWFRWLFHRFTMFHWPKYTELCQNLTWYM